MPVDTAAERFSVLRVGFPTRAPRPIAARQDVAAVYAGITVTVATPGAVGAGPQVWATEPGRRVWGVEPGRRVWGRDTTRRVL